MAITRGRLANIQTLASTTGSIYSNPASTTTFVKGVELYNSNSTAEAVELYNVPDSGGSLGTAAATNRKLRISLAADETYIHEWPGDGLVLADTNDSLQAKSTTGSVVTVDLFGVKDV
jgi:hypothetical protein